MIKKAIASIFIVLMAVIMFSTVYLFITEWAKRNGNEEKIKKYEGTFNSALKQLY